MISLAGLPDIASTTEGRYFSSRSSPFQLGMTTLAASVRGIVLGASRGRGLKMSAE